MKVECLNTMFVLIWRHLEKNQNYRVEVLHFLASCSTAFCLWMIVGELFNMKRKGLELNIEINDTKYYFYHEATMFRRANDKNKSKRKTRTCVFINFRKLKKCVA